MKSVRFSFLMVLGLLAGMLVAAPSAAHAQAAEGKFTLPSAAHWGNLALPAGDYSFSLESSGRPAWITVRDGQNSVVGMIAPVSLSNVNYSNTSQLVLTHKGDEVFISSLRVGDLGVVFDYAVPEAAPEANTATQEGSVSLALKKALHLH